MSTDDQDFRGVEEVGESFDVGRLHDPVWRDHEEPHDGTEPVPTWLSFLLGGILFFGGFYVAKYDADFRPHVYDGIENLSDPAAWDPASVPRTEEELIRVGRKIYRHCQQCHQLDGRGQGDQYPPLAGSEWVDGDKASPEALIQMLLYGIGGEIEVIGKKYTGQMPGWGGQMRDDEIAAVLTFIRQEWGNQAEPIFPDAVSEVRRRVGLRGPLTIQELEALADEEGTPPPAPENP